MDAKCTAGAQIAIDSRDRDHDGCDYTCRDHEGHVDFGTYSWATTGA